MPRGKKNQDAPAIARHSKAQADEARARGSRYPDAIHEDTSAAREAKAEAVRAMDEMYAEREATRLGTSEDEETVTLLSPNPWANVTDSNGVRFQNGRAEGVKASLAERYLLDGDGYSVEGGSVRGEQRQSPEEAAPEETAAKDSE
jgi:hypothetical protein